MVMADGPASHDQVDDSLADPIVRDRRPTADETASVQELVRARRSEVAGKREKAAKEKRDERNANRREQYADAKPKPYEALAGREQIAKSRVIAEARARLMQLRNATAAPCSDHFLVKLRGRESEVVETWKTMQLLRIATKREADVMDVADNSPALKALAKPETRRKKADRMLSYAAKLEAMGVWSAFHLIEA